MEIRGDILIVRNKRRAEIHYSVEVKILMRREGEAGGIDADSFEVFTDDHGKQYGKGFGKLLVRLSCVHKEKREKRGRLHSI
ncbi:hypothetical protein A7K93_00920 [Candidatus Methylacidiphilum fumarolicum]|uniref:Uncharacterized protein n=2 Tax=Candidatus Methylacidiphilum fumarolicum TaxID=591154 RepID=I0JXB2_METFB|nr:hypothetical protein [Candidatus Methylacidiphilum fumarolicum]CCG91881.1 hypothetical protein MFUM_260011 [Methylacidiphilum fumariolicum SolV]MBW6414201.1 hypothetical protein [Candidatus Methylacidiphilum fumarolicum]TFE69964.1 hypothetical protein A7K73_04985 [Candidatus Methylacidiphilum fumarolicum]TFE73769.1 hypothetical protein A7K72_05585 [Candidatus Methylacidiphilum fumarolicum]TFE75624.1 hypothetical protein A7K93_00920 [Candidatus Methylacidiphilum fumarolicum]